MRSLFALILTCAAALPLRAEGDRPGDFDYYVLALSWSPAYCAGEGAGNAEQCDRRLGWILHGLWPQYDRGWPEYCQSAERPPSRRETAAMADISGTAGLAWHQWRKHGSCSGLSAAGYYAAERRAFGAVALPEVFARLKEDVVLPADVVEEAFLNANPGLTARGVTVECRSRTVREVRICLTRDLEPRDCGAEVARGCTLERAFLPAIR